MTPKRNSPPMIERTIVNGLDMEPLFVKVLKNLAPLAV
jgi:hypothetical protein